MGARLGPGSEVAGYRIRSVLGEGGMGIVYLAERPDGELCALKLLSATVGNDPSFKTRFKREAEYAARLDHPNVLKLFDTGETGDGTPFLAMEYARGTDLEVLITRDGVLSLPDALTILGQVGDALDCAHAMGIFHRDVKPGNIIVVQQPGDVPHAYLCDFGLSKNPAEDTVALTKQGHFIGTIAYTAPEEILGQTRNHLVDIYSLGCVLYETLVGTPPFVGERNLDVLYAHIGDPRPPATASRPDLPPPIDAIIAKAMAIAPEERYASCAEFIAAAGELLSEDMPAPPQRAFAPAPPLVRAQKPQPATELPAALRLVVTAGPALARELVVEDELVLGRLTTLDGALADDRGISRNHGRVHRAADGGFVVEDNDSANGTFVNGAEIFGPHPLRSGDELQIGSSVFTAITSLTPTPPAASPEPIIQPLGATRLSNAKPDDVEEQEQRPPDPPAEPDMEPSASPPDDSGSGAADAPPAPEIPLVDEPTDELYPRPARHRSEPGPPVVITMAPEAAAQRLVVRFEIDIDAGQITVTVDDSATARIVRHGDGWRTETDRA